MEFKKYVVFILIQASLFFTHQAYASVKAKEKAKASAVTAPLSSSSSYNKSRYSPSFEEVNPQARIKKVLECALELSCVSEIKKVKEDLKEKAHVMISAAITNEVYKKRVLDYECESSHLLCGTTEVGIKQRARCLAKVVLQKMIEKQATRKASQNATEYGVDSPWYKKIMKTALDRYIIPIHHHPPAQPKKVLLPALASSSASASTSAQRPQSVQEPYARPQSPLPILPRLNSSHGRYIPSSVQNKYEKQ